MRLDEFDYFLPKELIAQEPVYPRDNSRLMVINRKTKEIEHRIFRDIVEYINEGDLLVLNTTKVIPARLLGRKITGARVEVFLLERVADGVWKCMVKPGAKLKPGVEVVIKDGLKAKIVERNSDGTRIVEFGTKSDSEIFSYGEIPLPPYIENPDVDPQRYQTVFAKEEGAVAAPTAGLHFTEELIEKLRSKGVNFAEVVLHVGLGTFRPVKVESVEDHKMEEEFFRVPRETVELIEETKSEGKRVIAVGTTVVRTLETIARLPKSEAYSGKTDLFIYPPFEFKIVDALITNFHLPKSTLLMLVSAFSGLDLIKKAYKIAVKERYRFFSFGDACFII
ncbi:MAG: tRNA preQ1(34) S-adenosylmethionine ribosyltransferase-isomerase QueA [Thermotogaceae bacterium]|nr:tRNA preQ1(34) S-adenosylmethionine ribosyltransferase-isomerase QueA [Thermotogaceae bacterium]